MKSYDSRVTEINSSTANYGLDRLSVVLGLIAISISAGSAMAIGHFGALVLLVIPVVIFLIVVFVQPDYGLSIFIFITVTQISNVSIDFYGGPSIAQPVAGILMAVILLRIMLYSDRQLVWGRYSLVLIVYLIALFLSMINAADFTMSSTAFIGFFKDALGGVIVILLIQRPNSFRQAIWALIIAGIFMGTISVFQAVTETYDKQYFGFGGWQSQTAGEGTRNRLTGPFSNPNAYSQVLVVIFALGLERLWHEKRSLLRIFAGWAAIVTSLSIVFTYSRGGLLTFVATLAVLFLQNRPRLVPLLLTMTLGLTLVQILPSDYALRISTLNEINPTQNNDQIYDPSFRGRLSENIAAWRMFLDNPFFGVGLGNFKIEYQNYSPQIGLDYRRSFRTPASLYLEVLSEQGLFGFIAFVLLIYAIFAGLLSARVQFSRAVMQDQSNLTMGLIAGFAGYMIAATVKNSAYSEVFWILVGMSISVVQIALVSSYEKSELSGSRKVL